jgi:hypothetical protein
MVRPAAIGLDARAGDVSCRIGRVQFLGGIIRYTATADAALGEVTIDAQRPIDGIGEGAAAWLRLAAADAIVYLAAGRA